MKEALGSSETSVLTRATWRNIPEDTILYSYHHENLKSYMIMNNYKTLLIIIEERNIEIWRMLHTEELHDFHSSSNIVRQLNEERTKEA
jgi:hypothetical protein